MGVYEYLCGYTCVLNTNFNNCAFIKGVSEIKSQDDSERRKSPLIHDEAKA